MPQRQTLDWLIRNSDETYASVSILIGRNPAYIQQFMKRGTPACLCQSDIQIIAKHFGIPADLFSVKMTNEERVKQMAANFAQRALDACDLIGLNEAACHIQYGLDIIVGAQPLRAESTH